MKGLNRHTNINFKVRGISFLVAIITFLNFLFFSYVDTDVNALDNSSYEIQTDQALLSEAKAILNRYYIDPISEEVLASGGISEMLYKLGDPYSDYFTKEEYNEFVNSIDNRFVGIGVNIEAVTYGIKVINVMKGSPAEEAGIKDNDIIVKANNTSLIGLSAEEAVKYIKGVEGTTVVVTIKRENTLLEFLVIRRVITMPTVEWEVKNSVGYISLNSFGENTGSEFEGALNALSLSNINGYIVDLRFNPGGYITSALDIGGYFIGNNPMTLIEDNEGTTVTYNGFYHKEIIDKPIIFLINEYSVSASELLSAAVKDYKKAIFIGKTTYGKGVGQSIFGLSDGSMLKLTTIRFFSPLGNTINHVGVAPDFYVNEDIIASEEVAKFLLLNAGKEKEIEAYVDKTSYVKIKIEDSIFYIDLKDATKVENWEVYSYILENIKSENIYFGSKNGWINCTEEKLQNKVDLFFPDHKRFADIEKSKYDESIAITFNHNLKSETLIDESIQLINSKTGERVEKTLTLGDKNKIVLSPNNALVEGETYYLIISKGLKSEEGLGLNTGVAGVLYIK